MCYFSFSSRKEPIANVCKREAHSDKTWKMTGRLCCLSHLNRSRQTFPSVGVKGGTISASPSCGELPCSTKPVRSKPKNVFSTEKAFTAVRGYCCHSWIQHGVHSCCSKPAIKIILLTVPATGIWSPSTLHLSNPSDGLVTWPELPSDTDLSSERRTSHMWSECP